MGLSFRVWALVERLFATSFNTLHPILALMGFHPRLSASRPCGACPLFLLRLCSGQALHERGDRLFRQPPAPRAIPSRLPPQSRAALPAAVSRRGSAGTFSLHLGFIWGSMRTTSPDI